LDLEPLRQEFTSTGYRLRDNRDMAVDFPQPSELERKLPAFKQLVG